MNISRRMNYIATLIVVLISMTQCVSIPAAPKKTPVEELEMGSTICQPNRVVKAIKDGNLDVNKKHKGKIREFYPLIQAITYTYGGMGPQDCFMLVRLLVEKYNADVNIVDNTLHWHAMTPLHAAIKYGKVETFKYLTSKGADPKKDAGMNAYGQKTGNVKTFGRKIRKELVQSIKTTKEQMKTNPMAARYGDATIADINKRIKGIDEILKML